MVCGGVEETGESGGVVCSSDPRLINYRIIIKITEKSKTLPNPRIFRKIIKASEILPNTSICWESFIYIDQNTVLNYISITAETAKIRIYTSRVRIF